MMKTKAERNKQLRNALIASAVSLAGSAVIAAIALSFFKIGPVTAIFVLAVSFVLILAVMIFLWKKTDMIRRIFYVMHCIRYPAPQRKYSCPCCGRTFAQFNDPGLSSDPERYDPARFTKERQDVICPFCYSAPRQRILACWAEDNKTELMNSKILYFAPEYSMMKWFRANRIMLTTADLFDPAADIKLDITDIDLPDGSYDMVICNHVLEHVSNYEKALSELNRILRPEGKLIISFPIDMTRDTVLEQEAVTPEERIRLYGQNDHVRLFGKDSREKIAAFGFKVDVIDTGNMPEAILPVTGPADYDSNQIFYCVKAS